MLGNDDEDPLFLQLKEAGASVLEPYLGASRFAHPGQRVVEGQRLMQAASDIMLGWFKNHDIDGVERTFYIRQLWDGKGSAIVEVMQPNAMTAYAEVCGWALAHAHARSGDAVAIAAYLGSGDPFDRALAAFAEAYADQNERDYAAFKDAVDTGRTRGRNGSVTSARTYCRPSRRCRRSLACVRSVSQRDRASAVTSSHWRRTSSSARASPRPIRSSSS